MGFPHPILAAGPARIDAVVPFGVATSGTTTISVLRDGNLVGTITDSLYVAAPKLFTVDGTGYGAAAWNQDGTPNSAANPASIGEVVIFYGTGAGKMSPQARTASYLSRPRTAQPLRSGSPR